MLEVKGGRIRREGGVWVFTDRYDQEHRKTEGPFEQASTAMFTLERELRREFKDTRLAQVLMGFGVIAPDVGFSVMGPDIERDPNLRLNGSKCTVQRVRRPACFILEKAGSQAA